MGTGTRNCSFFLVVSEQVLEKVSEPVSVKFEINKSRNRYQKNLIPKKVLVSVSKIFGTGKSIGIGIVLHFGYRHTLANNT